MNRKSGTMKDGADKPVKNIRRKTRRPHSPEEKIRIVLAGLRGEESIAALCRREGIGESLYYSWSKEFLEAGKRRLAGDPVTAREWFLVPLFVIDEAVKKIRDGSIADYRYDPQQASLVARD